MFANARIDVATCSLTMSCISECPLIASLCLYTQVSFEDFTYQMSKAYKDFQDRQSLEAPQAAEEEVSSEGKYMCRYFYECKYVFVLTYYSVSATYNSTCWCLKLSSLDYVIKISVYC